MWNLFNFTSGLKIWGSIYNSIRALKFYKKFGVRLHLLGEEPLSPTENSGPSAPSFCMQFNFYLLFIIDQHKQIITIGKSDKKHKFIQIK